MIDFVVQVIEQRGHWGLQRDFGDTGKSQYGK